MPAKIAESGFCLQEGGKIYHREKYRFKFYSGFQKHKNEQVEKLAQDLVKNLTISRVFPHHVSVSTSYLMELEGVMDELSKGMLLQLTSLKYQIP